MRERALALEIDGERLAQLASARRSGGPPAGAAPGLALAGANLRRYWRSTAATATRCGRCWAAPFPRPRPAELEASLDWLED